MANAYNFRVGGVDIPLQDKYAANRYLELIDLGTFANGTEWQSYYTGSGQKADISSGQFQKAMVGCKATINSHTYLFAHPNYWLHTGDTECRTNHMLVVPLNPLCKAQMHITQSGGYESGSAANTTAGGYYGSDMRSNANGGIAQARAIIQADFGSENILVHREYLTNQVDAAGFANAGAWYDSDVELMNERMVYGASVFENCINGTGWPCNYTIDKSQLKLFAERPDLITNRASWWLRDVASSTNFALVSYSGFANLADASNAFGVRPVFAIC